MADPEGRKRARLRKSGRTIRVTKPTLAQTLRLIGIPGSDLPHVHYLRTLADSRALIAAATAARRVVVIGASFIGLEVAASLLGSTRKVKGSHVTQRWRRESPANSSLETPISM